jgi:hypothetical protein
MFEGLRKPKALIVIVVTLLAYGCPIQAIVQAFGLDERTVASSRTPLTGGRAQPGHQLGWKERTCHRSLRRLR